MNDYKPVSIKQEDEWRKKRLATRRGDFLLDCEWIVEMIHEAEKLDWDKQIYPFRLQGLC